MNDRAAPADYWPRPCLCNECEHVKVFGSWAELETATCDQCGEHATDGDGYCWCEMCSDIAADRIALEICSDGDQF